MITVLTTFYHPDLGTIRGTIIDGVPMLSCRETVHLLGCFDYKETELVMRDHYVSKDVIVPVGVDEKGTVATELLLFIDAVAVLRLVECSGNRAGDKYAAWFADFVFPILLQMDARSRVSDDARTFYWTCSDPISPKSPNPITTNLFE